MAIKQKILNQSTRNASYPIAPSSLTVAGVQSTRKVVWPRPSVQRWHAIPAGSHTSRYCKCIFYFQILFSYFFIKFFFMYKEVQSEDVNITVRFVQETRVEEGRQFLTCFSASHVCWAQWQWTARISIPIHQQLHLNQSKWSKCQLIVCVWVTFLIVGLQVWPGYETTITKCDESLTLSCDNNVYDEL